MREEERKKKEERADRNRSLPQSHAQDLFVIRVRGNPSLRPLVIAVISPRYQKSMLSPSQRLGEPSSIASARSWSTATGEFSKKKSMLSPSQRLGEPSSVASAMSWSTATGQFSKKACRKNLTRAKTDTQENRYTLQQKGNKFDTTNFATNKLTPIICTAQPLFQMCHYVICLMEKQQFHCRNGTCVHVWCDFGKKEIDFSRMRWLISLELRLLSCLSSRWSTIVTWKFITSSQEVNESNLSWPQNHFDRKFFNWAKEHLKLNTASLSWSLWNVTAGNQWFKLFFCLWFIL